MGNARHQYRKTVSLLFLTVAATLATAMSSPVRADGLIDYRPADPGTRLTSLFRDEGYLHDPENPASRLQVYFTPPAVATAASRAGRGSTKPSNILLSWRILW